MTHHSTPGGIPAAREPFRILLLSGTLILHQRPAGETVASCGNLGHALLRWSSLTAESLSHQSGEYYVIVDQDGALICAAVAALQNFAREPAGVCRIPRPSLN